MNARGAAGRLAKILDETISEAGGQISRISLERRPETGLKGTEHGSIPSAPANHSSVGTKRAKSRATTLNSAYGVPGLYPEAAPAYGGPIQLIAGLLEFKAGNTFGTFCRTVLPLGNTPILA
jgi:GPR1/FUN34/yaaH family